MALAAGVGPLIAGAIYDRFGGYGPFLAAGAIGCVFGGILMISLPAYPAFLENDDGDDPEVDLDRAATAT
jgi:MFS family permease